MSEDGGMDEEWQEPTDLTPYIKRFHDDLARWTQPSFPSGVFAKWPRITPDQMVGAPIVFGGECIGIISSAERVNGPDYTDAFVCEVIPDPESSEGP